MTATHTCPHQAASPCLCGMLAAGRRNWVPHSGVGRGGSTHWLYTAEWPAPSVDRACRRPLGLPSLPLLSASALLSPPAGPTPKAAGASASAAGTEGASAGVTGTSAGAAGATGAAVAAATGAAGGGRTASGAAAATPPLVTPQSSKRFGTCTPAAAVYVSTGEAWPEWAAVFGLHGRKARGRPISHKVLARRHPAAKELRTARVVSTVRAPAGRTPGRARIRRAARACAARTARTRPCAAPRRPPGPPAAAPAPTCAPAARSAPCTAGTAPTARRSRLPAARPRQRAPPGRRAARPCEHPPKRAARLHACTSLAARGTRCAAHALRRCRGPAGCRGARSGGPAALRAVTPRRERAQQAREVGRTARREIREGHGAYDQRGRLLSARRRLALAADCGQQVARARAAAGALACLVGAARRRVPCVLHTCARGGACYSRSACNRQPPRQPRYKSSDRGARSLWARTLFPVGLQTERNFRCPSDRGNHAPAGAGGQPRAAACSDA